MEKPTLQRGLSSLSSQNVVWNSSRASSPVKTSGAKSSVKTIQNAESTNTDLSKENYNQDRNGIDEHIPWYIKYYPRNIDEVVIHKRKLKDVKDELESMLSGNSSTRILLLTGPSGSSKSTVIKELAKELIPQYRSNLNHTVSLNISSRGDNDSRHNVITYENDSMELNASPVDSFDQFLKNSKYKVGKNLSLILVEELPNVFHYNTRMSFKKSLEEWIYLEDTMLPPLVICLTECEIKNDDHRNINSFNIDTVFNAETILGRELLNHPRLKRIKFNSINATLMKKHLTSIALDNKDLLVQNNKWRAKEQLIKDISLLSGDLRSAIAALEFWSSTSANISMFTRTETITYFHAIGKIIHGSKETSDDNEMINNLFHGPTNLVLNDNFRLGLLESYDIPNRGNFDIDIAADVTNSLSYADIYNNCNELSEYAARKIRYRYNKINTKSTSSGKTKFSREWKIIRLEQEFKVQAEDYQNISIYKYQEPKTQLDVVLYDSYYSPYIKKLRNFKKKSMSYYIDTLTKSKDDNEKRTALMNKYKDNFNIDENIDILDRIGGEIQMINSEEIMVTVDDDNNGLRSINDLISRKEIRLKNLLNMYDFGFNSHDSILNNEQDGLEEGSSSEDDPILNTSDEEESRSKHISEASHLDEDEDDSLYEILSQKKPMTQMEDTSLLDESLSDSDLEGL